MTKAETTNAPGTKVPVTNEGRMPAPIGPQTWRPFDSLKREVDRLFEDFAINPLRLRRPSFDIEPFWQPESWIATPAVDLVERDNDFELAAELPGLEEKNIELKVTNGVLTVRGSREENREEKKEDYHLKERRYGSFERSFRVPETVDQDKIEASFKNGVLTVTMPKAAEAQKPAKTIPVKGN